MLEQKLEDTEENNFSPIDNRVNTEYELEVINAAIEHI